MPEVRTAGFVKCCQDESGFFLYCLAGESTWNSPKLFNLKALIQLQTRTKDCTVSPSHPPQRDCLLHCWTGTALSTGRPHFGLAQEPWLGSSHQYFPVICQQWKSSNKTSKSLPNNPRGQHLTSSFSEWHNKLGSTVCFPLLLLFIPKFQTKNHFHNEFSSLELKAH